MEENNKTIAIVAAVIMALFVLIIIIFAALFAQSVFTPVFPSSTLSTTEINETGGSITNTGYTLVRTNVNGFSSPVIVTALNTTSGAIIGPANYTVSSQGVLTNASAKQWNAVTVTYTYSYSTPTNNAVTNMSNSYANGVSRIGASIPLLMLILGIVVILAAIVILLYYVRNLHITNAGGL